MDCLYQLGEQTFSVRVEPDGARYRVYIDGQVFQVEEAQWQGAELRLSVDGRRRVCHAAAAGAERWVALDAQVYRFTLAEPGPGRASGRRAAAEHRPAALEAPMPGVVRQVLAAAGELVERGQPLLILEAMKMELKVAAPHAGRVTQIHVRAGETVQRGQTLAELDATASEGAQP